ncbi:MAG TPA: beta-glucanase precursor [Candidatus Omnitrophota bacterium]|nr:beta-glucanase precursor [Candidatus Omnitrophota bacterium]
MMKRYLILLTAVLGLFAVSTAALALDFGDYKSSTLTAKAWGALNSKDYKEAIIYTDKCIELYSDKAREMQAKMNEYPSGATEEIHTNYWALNDVATSLFIKGKALLELGQEDQAKDVFKTLIGEFTYGQCWDPNGPWFWAPARAAKDQLLVLEG